MEKDISMRNFKQYKKRIICAALAIQTAVVLLLTGCEGKTEQIKVNTEDAKNNIIMTIEDFNVTQQLYNLYVIQYMYNNKTEPISMDEAAVRELQDTVILELKSELVQYLLAKQTEGVSVTEESLAAYQANAASMYNFFGESFLAEYGIDRACVDELFEQQAYISALRDKALADLTDTYTKQYEEEYKDLVFHSVYYALFPAIEYDKDGNPVQTQEGAYVSLSEADMKENQKKAEELMNRAKAGEEMETLAKEYGIEAYSKIERNYDGAYSEELNAVIEGLSEGDISDVIKTEAGYMVVRMDRSDDQDYKTYMIQSAAAQTANNQIVTLQANWLKASGAEGIEADQTLMDMLDVIALGKEMQKKGFY